MIGLLVALYPRKWRGEFGEEFAALLEETRLTPLAVADVIVHAGKVHTESHRRLVLVFASLLWSGCLDYLAVRAHLTANILWAPTTLARALALTATLAPWLTLLACVILTRRRAQRHTHAGGSAP